MHFESEAGFKALFQYATIGIIVVDENGTIVIANPNCEKLFGYASSELIGVKVEKLIPDEYHSKHENLRSQYFSKPKAREMGSGKGLYAIKKDGERFPVQISLSHYRTELETIAIAFITDVSQQKEYTAELEKQVTHRTQQLETLLSEEQSISDLKSKFISIASHEFRTPLSTILSSTSLIEKYLQIEDTASQLKHINRVKTTVKHLNTILTDFLSLQKLEEGMIENNPVLYNISDLANEILVELEGVKKEGQVIEYEFKGLNIDVLIDKSLLKVCLTNLLTNAIKYSDANSTINFIIQRDQEIITFIVIDVGIGIPEKDFKFLFGRFFRASNVGSVKGTGLGLNIIKKYVEIMGGKISVESQELIGSKFTIILPLSK